MCPPNVPLSDGDISSGANAAVREEEAAVREEEFGHTGSWLARAFLA